jgi:NADPH:quinone reductase
VINYETHDFAEEAKRLTGGKGVDLILDAVGKPTFEKGIGCLAPFGHTILYGRAGGPPDKLDVFKLFEKSLKVSGFVMYTASANPELMRKGIEHSFGLIREGKLKLLIGKSYPLAEAPAAHRFIESRGSVGKLVLIP